MRDDGRDPRTIITPEAFEIDPRLLGMPLATPARRLWAIAIDFALVGLLTAALSDAQILLWGAIALALLWLALKRSPRTVTQAAGWLLRGSAGCLGVAILAGVIAAWGIGRTGRHDAAAALGNAIERGARLSPAELSGAVDDADYRSARTPAEALAVMEGVAARMADVPAPLRRQVLRATVPPDAPWAAGADSLIDLALAHPTAAEATAGADAAAADSAAAGVAALTDAQVLSELASARGEQGASPRTAALRARALRMLGSDTIEALRARVRSLDARLADEREARQTAEREATESRSGVAAFASLLRDLWQQLGSAVGLWSVYFTVLTSMWQGQTIGKRVMRVRVLRLDGEPIGWWSAFERAGGYVAGLATGLLGFAQVFWDRNRQCIHDKIVGTVVIADGAERVEGAWDRRTRP